MIGAVKRALLAVMSHRKLNDEIMLTVFAEVEYIINSRPLTHVSDDIADPVSLTPNIFLLGSPDLVIPPGTFAVDGTNWRRRWRIAQNITDQFWRRWLREYIPTLVTRSKWTRPERNLAVYDVVVINDPGFSRGQWPLGVIESAIPGKDNVVRTVDVRTTKGVLRRPAVKVHPFVRVDEDMTRGGECDGDASTDTSDFLGFDMS
jgi:Family of unknown function (DUF5641)